jgi:hypothetical protein
MNDTWIVKQDKVFFFEFGDYEILIIECSFSNYDFGIKY